MMKRRSKADWQALISEQESSGLLASEFCRQKDMNAKYFSLRKQGLKKSASGFIQAVPVVREPTRVVPGEIKLRVIEVALPVNSCGQSDTVTALLDRLLR
jgi:hypothetical protein